jgi:hypothetical protein
MDAEQLCVLFPWLADACNCLGGPLAWRPEARPARPATDLSLALHAPHAPQASRFYGSMTSRCPSHAGLLSHRNATPARRLRSQGSGYL